MAKKYVPVRVETAVHLRLEEERERMRLVRKFQPLETQFKHDFSLSDVIAYLLDAKDEHRARAKKQNARKGKSA